MEKSLKKYVEVTAETKEVLKTFGSILLAVSIPYIVILFSAV